VKGKSEHLSAIVERIEYGVKFLSVLQSKPNKQTEIEKLAIVVAMDVVSQLIRMGDDDEWHKKDRAYDVANHIFHKLPNINTGSDR